MFGLWTGTIRQFNQFVEQLNLASASFGIRFGDSSIGSEINFLDVTLRIDEEGLIQYKLFKKPTDSRLYLKTQSFHPQHVFNSVAYSQMVRVRNRNSTEETAAADLADLEGDLIKCGHKKKNLDVLKSKMQSNMSAPKADTPGNTAETITVVTDYFHEIDQLKTLLKEIQPDINRLAGKETKVLVASRKGKSIGNKSVKNRKLCEQAEDNNGSQKCGGKGCKTCPLLCDAGEIFYINSTGKSEILQTP